MKHKTISVAEEDARTARSLYRKTEHKRPPSWRRLFRWLLVKGRFIGE